VSVHRRTTVWLIRLAPTKTKPKIKPKILPMEEQTRQHVH
jgi:hypothetical protein